MSQFPGLARIGPIGPDTSRPPYDEILSLHPALSLPPPLPTTPLGLPQFSASLFSHIQGR